MEYVIDTSIVIAVIVNEADKERIVLLTEGATLFAPPSLHWEIGNAFAAMLKRRRITLEVAQRAVAIYQKIPIRFLEVEIGETLQLAAQLNRYAYDAYVLLCAQKRQATLLTLDSGLRYAARQLGITAPEISA